MMEIKGLHQKATQNKSLKWNGNPRKRGIKEGPLRKTTSRNGKGKMASVAREVNAIFNNPKDYEPQRINLEKSNESLPSKGNGIESQINHDGYIFNIFFY